MGRARSVALVDADLRLPRRVGSNCIAKFGLTPDSLMDLWIRTLAKHGIDSFWIYDCLYNMDEMERLCRTSPMPGARGTPAIMYGISPVHTDEWFAARVREIRELGHHRRIYFEDAAGILKPERAKTLMPALVDGRRRHADRDAMPQHRRRGGR